MALPSNPETRELPFPSLSATDALERTDSEPPTNSSSTPSNASFDSPLLTDVIVNGQAIRTPRSHSTYGPGFVSSPLNPNTPLHPNLPPSVLVGIRGQSRQSMVFNRVPSEDSQALASQQSSLPPTRVPSMILYRVADADELHAISPPPRNRQSVLSNSGDSVFTVSYDSKYPSGAHTPQKLVAYPFDPTLHIDTPEDDDALHDPSDDSQTNTSGLALRGFLNVGVLVLVILALLCLFIFYPVWHFTVQDNGTVP